MERADEVTRVTNVIARLEIERQHSTVEIFAVNDRDPGSCITRLEERINNLARRVGKLKTGSFS